MRCTCGSDQLSEVKEGFRCRSCGRINFWNPPTVAAGVIPIEDRRSGRTGVVLIERADGGLAFPGGYQGREDIFEAVSREVREETAIALPEHEWEFFDYRTTPDLRHNLFFALHTGLLTPDRLNDFVPNSEVRAIVLATGPVPMKYPLHEKVLRKFFELQQRMMGAQTPRLAAAGC